MQHALACANDQGAVGMVQDDAKASKWFKRAADNNYPCNHAVGYGYAVGKGVETNTRRALMYFERGVAKGRGSLLFRTGLFL
jgi:TPR repeat protein